MKTRTEMRIESLGQAAAETAMLGAHEYLKSHRLFVYGPALAACVKAHVKAALPGALADALDALECGMDAVAGWTFDASMVLAGIEGAKEAEQPKEMVARRYAADARYVDEMERTAPVGTVEGM